MNKSQIITAILKGIQHLETEDDCWMIVSVLNAKLKEIKQKEENNG